MGKVAVVIIFALAVCWGAQKFINISGTAFTLAQVPISWTMVVFVGGVGLCYFLVKK